MSEINPAQEQEVAYISGVTAQQTIAEQSFWTWERDDPVTYGASSHEAKWGAPVAGTGATVSVAFDAASGWTAAERAAIQTALHLWSNVADIVFVVGGSGADIVFKRGTDGAAETTATLRPGVEGSSRLGTITGSTISIDTSVAGFGPIGGDFQTIGGYPWMTLVHEIGHAIGLGHAGAYDEGVSTNRPALTVYDNTAYSVMSYHAATTNATGGLYFAWGTSADNAAIVPVTPMMLDIAAAQRLYGLPAGSALSGGQTFGFHASVPGDTASVYDFTVNTRPVVTLWDAGTGNTLDLSGFSGRNTVDLNPGTFSSTGDQYNNIAIAFGARIDGYVGGTGQDYVRGNDDGDVLMGGSGDDTITGGAGNDHIWGNLATTAQGAADGTDTIVTGGGTNYVNGNAGRDYITGQGVADRLYGGGGDDYITIDGEGVGHANGNAGADWITINRGTNFVNGGRDNDRIVAIAGNNVLHGDDGDDIIVAGTGVDVLTGGAGRDVFAFAQSQPSDFDPYAFASGQAYRRPHAVTPLSRDGALSGYHDEITDFTPGQDRIAIGNDAGGSRTVLHGDTASYGSVDAAAAYAQTLVAASGNHAAIAAVQVGGDTFLFYNEAGTGNAIDAAIRLDGLVAQQVQSADIVLSW